MPDQILHTVLDDLREEPDRLIEIILAQAQQIQRLHEELDSLKQTHRALHDQLDEARREGKRQAAPFRRDDAHRSEAPKKPGRKGGHQASYRRPPEHIDRHVEVPFDEASGSIRICPGCGGPLERVRPIEQIIEELPRVKPEVIRLVTYRGCCRACGSVETHHRLSTSRATGAAGVHLGARAQAVATALVYRHGLTLRRACQVLEGLFGLKLSPGGLAQLTHRLSEEVTETEAELLDEARRARVQHVDETSWWVAQAEKPAQWLWVFANEEQTLYRVRPRRAREVVQEVLTGGFDGVVVSDCLNIYQELDTKLFAAGARQQKCYAHHLKALSEQQQRYRRRHGETSPYLDALRLLLKAALALGAEQPELPRQRVQQTRRALEARADRLLASGRADPQEEKVRQRLAKQRRHLFVFLDEHEVAATNNLAERRLRPAVIRRKLSCGNRSERGARTWERLASVVATCVQQGRSVVAFLEQTASLSLSPHPLR